MTCKIILLIVIFLNVASVSAQFLPQTHFPTDSEESMPVKSAPDADNLSVDVPRGFYHFSDTAHKAESKFRIPDFESIDPLQMTSDLLSAAAKVQTRRKALSGLNIPLPIGGKPMDLQVSSDFRSDTAFSQSEKENVVRMHGSAKEAFDKAREICLHSNVESCDEALDTYHRVRYGTSLVQPAEASDPRLDLATMVMPSLRTKLQQMQEPVVETTSEPHLLHLPRRGAVSDSQEGYSEPRPLPPSQGLPQRRARIRQFLSRIT